MVIESVPYSSIDVINSSKDREFLSLTKKYGILIIDNNSLLLRNIQFMLKKFGFTVYTASSELYGIETFKYHKQEIKLIVMNTNLSELTGMELYAIFKTLDPDIKIALIVHEGIILNFWQNLTIDSYIIEHLQLNNLLSIIKSIRE